MQTFKAVRMIGTVPRSGTNYLQYFFHFYEDYCRLGADALIDRDRSGKPYIELAAAGDGCIFVGHGHCPGFAEACDDRLWHRWRRWPESSQYNAVKPIIGQFNGDLSPARNPNSRIVFLFRNPLDQALSMRGHLHRHLSRTATSAEPDFDRFFTVFAVHYAKLYMTYKAVHARYPGNVLMLPYEDLVGADAEKIRGILDFFGWPVDSPSRESAFAVALDTTRPASLKQLEKTLGHTLANDLAAGAGESHIRNGRPGAWRKELGEAYLTKAEAVLRELDLDPTDFRFG